ncbi:MAG: ferritin-like domain-containing protein [Hymenobacter sp.]|nr:MAG: ferritin-like domain-containing protein [Hymenobacter sp.]
MDFFQLISDLEKADPEFLDRINPRRRVFKYLGNTGKKMTAAAVPAVLASFFNKAYGQTTALPATVVAVLDLALQLEYLEYYFYNTALATTGIVGAAETDAIRTILNDEAGHISSLRGIPGWTPRADPGRAAFDYSGGSGTGTGPLAAALAPGAANQQLLFYGAAQAFADTGMRAYKGGAPVLNTAATKDILEAALNIHSVEARHNSHFRTVRRGLVANTLGVATAPAVAPYDAAPKSWISNIDNGGPVLPSGAHPAAAVYNAGTPAASYPAESNTAQAGITLTTLNAAYTATAVAEAFDEPLDAATVKTIAKMFVTPASGLFN